MIDLAGVNMNIKDSVNAELHDIAVFFSCAQGGI